MLVKHHGCTPYSQVAEAGTVGAAIPGTTEGKLLLEKVLPAEDEALLEAVPPTDEGVLVKDVLAGEDDGMLDELAEPGLLTVSDEGVDEVATLVLGAATTTVVTMYVVTVVPEAVIVVGMVAATVCTLEADCGDCCVV